LNNNTWISIKYHAKIIAFISPFEIMIFLYFKSFFIQNNVINNSENYNLNNIFYSKNCKKFLKRIFYNDLKKIVVVVPH
jgi:hypothetical protein